MLLYTESLVPVPENDLDLELVAVNNHDAGFRPITMNIFGAILGLPGSYEKIKEQCRENFPLLFRSLKLRPLNYDGSLMGYVIKHVLILKDMCYCVS